ncbi:hypothetical protein SAMN02745885_01763 [Carboxydocella sporoproducens DSM 16521]|uniref:Uncharacterized protein n=2 Tax=Carboxydocella TaxID=178898 RepID=A0A1T4QRC1_9FIRM|nr:MULTISPECIES: hypothetical protein [Carboxydocella]AVX20843.1 hypothetical protein CFE_1668 [Carboxydocella thermautotrophica]SKA06245.1 hypothetical protein SAMN02745885_01763 [Carboxydocella sporoproducens DSM 16521]
MLRNKTGLFVLLLLYLALAQPVLANPPDEEKRQAEERRLQHTIIIDITGDSKKISNLSAVRALAGEGIWLQIPDPDNVRDMKPAAELQAYLYLADSLYSNQEATQAYDKIVQDASEEILNRAKVSWAAEKPEFLKVQLVASSQHLSRLNKQLLNLYGSIYQAGVWPGTLLVINIKDSSNYLSIWKGPGLMPRDQSLILPGEIYNQVLEAWVNRRLSSPPLPSLALGQNSELRLWQKEISLWQQSLARVYEMLAEKEKVIRDNETTIKNIATQQANWQQRERELHNRLTKNLRQILFWRGVAGALIILSVLLLIVEYRILRKRYLLF